MKNSIQRQPIARVTRPFTTGITMAARCLFACALGALTLGSVGCAEETEPYGLEITPVTVGPVAVGEHFAVLNITHNELWLLEDTTEGMQRNVVNLEGTAISLRATPDERLAILTTDESTMLLIDPDDPTASQVYPLESGYDRVTISDDGRFALLYFAVNSNGSGNAILINPNEVTLIDFEEGEQTVFSLRGPRPQSFMFLDPVTLDDPNVQRRFAAAFSTNAVSLVDLETDSETDRQRLIPLVSPSSDRQVSPREMLVSHDDPTDPNDLKLFVRVSGANDLYVIDVIPSVDPGAPRELQPSINQIGFNSPLQDILSFEAGSGADRSEFLLAMSGSTRTISVIDVATNSTTEIALDREVQSAVVWEDTDEFGVVVPRALMFARNSDLVYFARLDELSRQGMGALRAQRLSNPVDSVQLVEGGSRTRAVVRYAGGTGVGILNVDDRFEYPIEATLTLGEFAIVGDLLFTAVPGIAALGIVDLETTGTGQVDVASTAGQLVHAPATNRLMVVHDDPTGWYSFVNIADLEQTPTEVQGLFLNDIMDRGDEQ